MDLSTIVSVARFGQTLLPPQESTSETRRALFDAVVGQRRTVTPQNGPEIVTQIDNCAYLDDDGETLLAVRVTDAQRPRDIEAVEREFRYQYFHMYERGSQELHNPLVTELEFFPQGPEAYSVELRVASRDAPTMQLLASRVEAVAARLRSDLHHYLRRMYTEYADAYEASREFVNGEFEYSVTTELDTLELIPPRGSEGIADAHTGEAFGHHERFNSSYLADAYIRYMKAAEAGESAAIR